MEEDAVRLNDRCSTALQNQPPPKENDPVSFTLPCLIGNSNIRSALADLRASINVMPFSMFKRLQIGNIQPTIDFVIMDMVEDPNVPLILGRPLLATAHAHIDIFNKQISLGVEEERILFKINQLVDDPYITHESVCMIEFSKETHEEELELLLASNPQSSFMKMKAQSCIVNTNKESEPFIQQLNPLPRISQTSNSLTKIGKKKGEITYPLSREIFNKWQAERWWSENCEKIMEVYNVQRFNQQGVPLLSTSRSEDAERLMGDETDDGISFPSSYEGDARRTSDLMKTIQADDVGPSVLVLSMMTPYMLGNWLAC
ncbi:hypothetical protein Tco_1321110 [Tanacetum coccineum]